MLIEGADISECFSAAMLFGPLEPWVKFVSAFLFFFVSPTPSRYTKPARASPTPSRYRLNWISQTWTRLLTANPLAKKIESLYSMWKGRYWLAREVNQLQNRKTNQKAHEKAQTREQSMTGACRPRPFALTEYRKCFLPPPVLHEHLQTDSKSKYGISKERDRK